MKFKKNSIDIISMGCSKNLVDSERLIRRLEAKGYSVNHDPETPHGEWVVVNTCGFIADAKEESIQLLMELGQLKERKEIGNLIMMGCLSERYRNEISELLPEVDRVYGKFDWKDFIEHLPDRSTTKEEKPFEWERSLTTPPYTAYMKISEGCNKFCAFCAIPLITGRHTSRPIEEILEETRKLVSEGVREFNIIAQDLSSYGVDLYGKQSLATLIDSMADIEGVEWIRLHYAYPSDFPYDILDVMANRPNVCNYLDIALQHIADPVLTNMRRHISGAETRELIKKIRTKVPDITLRTTLMVGFPGEDEKAFQELLEFVKETKFEHMGAFAYCEEEDTWAARNLTDDIPDEVKQKRLEQLMALQEEISEQISENKIGKTVRILIEEVLEDGTRTGRSESDSPEVDNCFYISETDAQPGDFINAEITGASAFDLYAKAIN